MARQSPSCDTASYCFALPLLHASYKRSDHASDQDSSRDAWSRSSPPVSDASPPLNLDTLPPHPNSCRWSTPSGRPPMAILEPPPPSDAVSHSAELFLRLAQLENEKSRTPTPELQDEAEFSSLQQRLAERAESPRIEYVPHTDPSAHPGFSSLPFWVPPRESPASIFYNPKAAQRARSQETTRDQGMAPTDCGNAEDRVARSSAENVIPSAVRVKREPEEQGLQPLLSPMSTDDVAMFKSEPMDEAPPPPPPTKRRRGEADADDEPRRPPLPLSPDSGGGCRASRSCEITRRRLFAHTASGISRMAFCFLPVVAGGLASPCGAGRPVPLTLLDDKSPTAVLLIVCTSAPIVPQPRRALRFAKKYGAIPVALTIVKGAHVAPI
ncbi:hypothetical protein BD626DRAFT_572812 [Schizophyllum amplum]|uniref:Uncharacterized protein n=1 Tax=Schizophyllum amplum TaxID=97359 RepID=A0A550C343_9AGAR|nr:hypothetical protein BD626DRAFT_572812 [Auriculariopsis ampla]